MGRPFRCLIGWCLSLLAFFGLPTEASPQMRWVAQEGPSPPFSAFKDDAGPSRTIPASEGALTLLLPVGAQGVAMARAMTATPGPEGAFWNPAGLGALGEGGRFLVFHSEHLAGEGTAFSLLFSHASVGTGGLSYRLLNLGDQDYRDREGNVLGTVSFRDHLAVLSFATGVLTGLDAGVNFKMVQSRVICRGDCSEAGVTGTTYAVDGGVLWASRTPFSFRLGAMVAHAGPRLQLINVAQADPLPTRLRIAGALEIPQIQKTFAGGELWLTLEVEDRARRLGSPAVYLGGELFLDATPDYRVQIRAGYGAGQGGVPAGGALGLGLTVQRFALGLAKRYAGGGGISGEGEPVHVTLGVSF